MSLLKTAISAWQEALGVGNVDIDPQHLKAIATATFATTNCVPVILRPANSKEVQACVKIANQYRIPIYPVSTGKNWGNGSSAPTTNGCAILHLAKLTQITDLDTKQACVTIEPGVTQGQLADYLKMTKSGLWADITGATADTSIIGNILERGVGYSPYSNRVSQICQMEVILPNGEIIVTGFGKYKNAKAANVYQWGIGPALDGLFAQSNLGVVTRVTLWLMPEPEQTECFYFKVNSESKLTDVIDALQPLRLRRILQSSVHIGNHYKIVNTYHQYPWQLTGGQVPMPQPVLQSLSEQIGCGAWNGSGALYGTKNEVREAKRLLCKALKGKVDKLSFLNDKRLAIAKKFPNLLSKLLGVDMKAMLPLIEAVYGMQKGQPADVMSSLYWRKKQIPSNDPDKDRCGLIWYSPIAPLDGNHAMKIYRVAKETLLKYSFEPLVAFAFMSERVLCCVIALIYDRDVVGEDQRAMQCHYELIDQLSTAGYYPYRAGVQNMEKFIHKDINYQNVIEQLKQTFDPHHILAPGRYEF